MRILPQPWEQIAPAASSSSTQKASRQLGHSAPTAAGGSSQQVLANLDTEMRLPSSGDHSLIVAAIQEGVPSVLTYGVDITTLARKRVGKQEGAQQEVGLGLRITCD